MTHFTLPVALPNSWRKMHWRSSRYSFLIVTATSAFFIALLPTLSSKGFTPVSIGSKEGAHFITVLLLISEVIAGLMLIFASIRLSRVHLYARFIGTLVTIMIVDLSLVKIFLSIQYSYKTTSSFNPSTSYLYHHSVVFVGILILLYFLNDESSGDMRDAPTVNSQLQEAEVFIRHIGIVAHVLFLTLWPLCIGGPLFDSGFTLHILPLIDQMYIILQMMIPATVVTAGLLRYRMPRISRCAGTFSKVVAGREHVVNDSHTYSLQEVHDRIKNNLQLVGSLLSLQANTQKESSARAVLTDTVNRVSAIATLYRLSDACGYRGVDLSQYCTYLGNELLERFEVSNRIVFKVEGEAIHVPVQVALCFGLMFNEIVSNSIRHGFPEECAGCVSVVIQHHKNRLLTISIRDNGIGLSRDMNEKEIPQGLGTRIIYQLAKQMRAEIEELDSPGHGYRIHIPL